MSIVESGLLSCILNTPTGIYMAKKKVSKIEAIVKRFLKAFIAGGLASIGVLVANGVTFSDEKEFKNFLLTLVGAFITGGIMAIQKWYSWTDAPKA